LKKKTKPRTTARDRDERSRSAKLVGMRIIGGKFRHRKLSYHGDIAVRPMKDRIREALFNLVGVEIKGYHVLDLFAGTGALGLEALSRGAARVTFIERHFPTAAVIRDNMAALDVTELCQVVTSDTFVWWKLDGFHPQTEAGQAPRPWVVFCSPPYEFFVSREAEVLELLNQVFAQSPHGSVLVVESDLRFPPEKLPALGEWDVRKYPPAQVAIVRKE
jgi:16S rRNA (guanine966-N2)-methyltransferase